MTSQTALVPDDERSFLRRRALGASLSAAWLGLASAGYAIFSIWAWGGGAVVWGSILSLFCGGTLVGCLRAASRARATRARLAATPGLPSARLLPTRR